MELLFLHIFSGTNQNKNDSMNWEAILHEGFAAVAKFRIVSAQKLCDVLRAIFDMFSQEFVLQFLEAEACFKNNVDDTQR